jgi:aspartate oxidase
MIRYHAGGDLAPRDVVARSIVREEDDTGGGVFLTLAHLDATFVARRFPTIAAMCRRIGLDLAHDPIPVGPAAHYIMGGVETDEWGRTSLTGLFAAGEVACTGVHGANRLASNSLLEGLVFGARAGIAMKQPAAAARMGKADRVDARALKPRMDGGPTSSGARPSGSEALPVTIEDVQRLMWQSAGLFRTGDRLASAVTRLRAVGVTAVETSVRSLDSWRRLHLLTVARLIAQAALRREESRGGHFRDDFPDRDDRHWKIHVVDRREDS